MGIPKILILTSHSLYPIIVTPYSFSTLLQVSFIISFIVLSLVYTLIMSQSQEQEASNPLFLHPTAPSLTSIVQVAKVTCVFKKFQYLLIMLHSKEPSRSFFPGAPPSYEEAMRGFSMSTCHEGTLV